MRPLRWITLPLIACLLVAAPADHFPRNTDPMLNYYGDPPTIYTILNSITGKETAVRINFPSFTKGVNVTNPGGFNFLRQSASVPGPIGGNTGRMMPRGGGAFPPDPDEFQFDPWDIPDPPDDFPLPDPPDLPDPFDDPLDLPDPPLDLPPFPDDDLPFTDFSPGTLGSVGVSGAPAGHSQPGPLGGVLMPKATTSVTVKGPIVVGPSAAGIATSPDQNTLYVAISGNGSIAVVDRKSVTLKSRITMPAGTQPYALAITPDGSRLYAGEFIAGSAAAYSIDLPSGTVKKLSAAGSYITQAVVTPDGTQVWFCGYFGNIQIYDVLTNAYVTTIQISNPWNVVFNASGTLAYVTNGVQGVPGAVTVFNTSTLQQVTSIPVGLTPRNIRITPTGRHLFVTNYDSNFVSQIDTATNTVIRTIPIGDSGASGLAMAHN